MYIISFIIIGNKIFILFLIDTLGADIHAAEYYRQILAEQAAGYSVAVSCAQLVTVKIRIYYRRFSCYHTGIYNVVDAGERELIRKLGSEIVDYQKVGGVISRKVCRSLRRAVAEAFVLKIGYHSA